MNTSPETRAVSERLPSDRGCPILFRHTVPMEGLASYTKILHHITLYDKNKKILTSHVTTYPTASFPTRATSTDPDPQ